MSAGEALESINELDSTRESQIIAAVPVYKNTMQQITQLYCCREKETIQKFVTNTSDGNLLIASATSLTVFSIKRELAYRTFESQKCLALYYVDISNMYIMICQKDKESNKTIIILYNAKLHKLSELVLNVKIDWCDFYSSGLILILACSTNVWAYKLCIAPNQNPPISIQLYSEFPKKGKVNNFYITQYSGLLLIRMDQIFYLFDLNQENHNQYAFVQKYTGVSEDNISQFIFDSVHHILCLVLDNGIISIYYAPSNSMKVHHLFSMEGHNPSILKIFFTDQPYELLTIGNDGYIRHWSLVKKRMLSEMKISHYESNKKYTPFCILQNDSVKRQNVILVSTANYINFYGLFCATFLFKSILERSGVASVCDVHHNYDIDNTKIIINTQQNKMILLSTEDSNTINMNNFNETITAMYYSETMNRTIVGNSNGTTNIYDERFRCELTLFDKMNKNNVTYITVLNFPDYNCNSNVWTTCVGTADGNFYVYNITQQGNRNTSYQLAYKQKAHSNDIILIHPVQIEEDKFLITVSRDGVIKSWTYPNFKMQNCIFIKQNNEVITKGGGGDVTSALYIHNYIIVGLDCGIIESWYNPLQDDILDDDISFTFREAHKKKILSLHAYNQAEPPFEDDRYSMYSADSRPQSRKNKYQEMRPENPNEFFSLSKDNSIIHWSGADLIPLRLFSIEAEIVDIYSQNKNLILLIYPDHIRQLYIDYNIDLPDFRYGDDEGVISLDDAGKGRNKMRRHHRHGKDENLEAFVPPKPDPYAQYRYLFTPAQHALFQSGFFQLSQTGYIRDNVFVDLLYKVYNLEHPEPRLSMNVISDAVFQADYHTRAMFNTFQGYESVKFIYTYLQEHPEVEIPSVPPLNIKGVDNDNSKKKGIVKSPRRSITDGRKSTSRSSATEGLEDATLEVNQSGRIELDRISEKSTPCTRPTTTNSSKRKNAQSPLSIVSQPPVQKRKKIMYDAAGERIVVDVEIHLSDDTISRPITENVEKRIDNQLEFVDPEGHFEIRIPYSFLPLWHTDESGELPLIGAKTPLSLDLTINTIEEIWKRKDISDNISSLSYNVPVQLSHISYQYFINQYGDWSLTQNKLLQFLYSVIIYKSIPECHSYGLLLGLYTNEGEVRYDACSVFCSVRRYLNTRVLYGSNIDRSRHPGHGYLLPLSIVTDVLENTLSQLLSSEAISSLQQNVKALAFHHEKGDCVYVEEVLLHLIVLWNNSDHDDDFNNTNISLKSSLSLKPIAVKREVNDNLMHLLREQILFNLDKQFRYYDKGQTGFIPTTKFREILSKTKAILWGKNYPQLNEIRKIEEAYSSVESERFDDLQFSSEELDNPENGMVNYGSFINRLYEFTDRIPDFIDVVNDTDCSILDDPIFALKFKIEDNNPFIDLSKTIPVDENVNKKVEDTLVISKSNLLPKTDANITTNIDANLSRANPHVNGKWVWGTFKNGKHKVLRLIEEEIAIKSPLQSPRRLPSFSKKRRRSSFLRESTITLSPTKQGEQQRFVTSPIEDLGSITYMTTTPPIPRSRGHSESRGSSTENEKRYSMVSIPEVNNDVSRLSVSEPVRVSVITEEHSRETTPQQYQQELQQEEIEQQLQQEQGEEGYIRPNSKVSNNSHISIEVASMPIHKNTIFANTETEYYDELWNWEVPDVKTSPKPKKTKKKKKIYNEVKKDDKWRPPRPTINTIPEITMEMLSVVSGLKADGFNDPEADKNRYNKFNEPTKKYQYYTKPKTPELQVIEEEKKPKHSGGGGMLSYPLNQKTNVKRLGHLPVRTDMPSVVMQAIQSAKNTPKHLKQRPESPELQKQGSLSRGTTPNVGKRDSKMIMRPELEHLRFSQIGNNRNSPTARSNVNTQRAQSPPQRGQTPGTPGTPGTPMTKRKSQSMASYYRTKPIQHKENDLCIEGEGIEDTRPKNDLEMLEEMERILREEEEKKRLAKMKQQEEIKKRMEDRKKKKVVKKKPKPQPKPKTPSPVVSPVKSPEPEPVEEEEEEVVAYEPEPEPEPEVEFVPEPIPEQEPVPEEPEETENEPKEPVEEKEEVKEGKSIEDIMNMDGFDLDEWKVEEDPTVKNLMFGDNIDMNPIDLLPKTDALPQWCPEDNKDPLIPKESIVRTPAINEKIAIMEYHKMFQRQKTMKPIKINVRYEYPWKKYFQGYEREMGLLGRSRDENDDDNFDLTLPKRKASPRDSPKQHEGSLMRNDRNRVKELLADKTNPYNFQKLLFGITVDREIEPSEWHYYYADVLPDDVFIEFKISAERGEIDLFVSNDTVPTTNDFYWHCESLGDPHILIPPSDPHFKCGNYLVGVFCHSKAAKYSISVNRFCFTEAAHTKALDNVEKCIIRFNMLGCRDLDLDRKLAKLEELARRKEIENDKPEIYDKLLRDCDQRITQLENYVKGKNNSMIDSNIEEIKEQIDEWQDVTIGINQDVEGVKLPPIQSMPNLTMSKVKIPNFKPVKYSLPNLPEHGMKHSKTTGSI